MKRATRSGMRIWLMRMSAAANISPPTPPEQSEQNILREQLPHQASASCPQRGAHGNLRPPRDAARKLQIGDIGADHQQHKQRGALHQVEVERGVFAVDVGQQGRDLYLPAQVRIRISLGQVLGDGIHVGLRLAGCDSFAQAANNQVIVRGAVGELSRPWAPRASRHRPWTDIAWPWASRRSRCRSCWSSSMCGPRSLGRRQSAISRMRSSARPRCRGPAASHFDRRPGPETHWSATR